MNRERLMEIHRKAIMCASSDESSLADAVRDEGTLEYILNHCESIKDPYLRAEQYLWCISNWHPFVEGNKRTAWLAAQDTLQGMVFYCDDAELWNMRIREIACAEDMSDMRHNFVFIEYHGDNVEYALKEQAELLRRLSE